MREGICKPKKYIPKCIYIAISDSYDRKNLRIHGKLIKLVLVFKQLFSLTVKDCRKCIKDE